MKKVLAILCALAMTVSCVSGMAFAEDASENLFLNAEYEGSSNLRNPDNAFDGNYSTEASVDIDGNDDLTEAAPAKWTIKFEGQLNKIVFIDHYGAGNGSNLNSYVKLYDKDDNPIAINSYIDKNAFTYHRQIVMEFDAIDTEVTVEIYDDANNKSWWGIREIEGYYTPDVDGEVKFEFLRDSANKNIVDVAVITSISETEAQAYTKLEYAVVVYNYVNKAMTKKDLSLTDYNVYDSVVIGESSYSASDINADDAYIGAIVLEDITLTAASDTGNASGAIVFVQVYGVDAENGKTVLTGLYRIDIPYEA